MSNFSTLFFPVSTVITNIDRLNPTHSSILMTINSSTGLFNTNNGTSYIVPWNSIEWQTNGAIISGSVVNDNIVINQTGIYRLAVRYASYDMYSGNNTLTLGVFFSVGGLITVAGGTRLATIGDGWTGTTTNGAAQKQGEYTFRVTSVPFYMVAVFSHTGATGGGFGVQGFPVFENTSQGTQPYWYVERIGNL